MAKKLTILQFADRLELMAKGLNKAVLPPFRENLKVMQRALYKHYWSNRFGARIWKWRQDKFGVKGGPSVKLGTRKRRSYARWSASNSAWIAQIRISGMAAMMETGGGRLRRHVIFGRAVRGGQQVPKDPFYDRIVEKEQWPRTIDDVSKSFWKFVERTL